MIRAGRDKVNRHGCHRTCCHHLARIRPRHGQGWPRPRHGTPFQ